MAERVRLDGPMELELPDGSLVRVQPGPYRKGISVVPIEGKTTRHQPERRGRKPKASTVRLRTRMRKDLAAGRDRPVADHIQWLMRQDKDISHASARQTVYRERRALREA